MKKGIFLAGLICAATAAMAQTAANPAARTHVRVINGVHLKYTSKLTRVVELNFTLGFTHTEGKQVIATALGRVAGKYAVGGKDAFEIRRFTSANSGSASGEMVSFTLSDLTSGEVIVANNISKFNELQAKSAAQASAFETAVKSQGRGVLGFHGSGDGGGGWKFYTDELHPVGYNNHGTREAGMVYKFSDNAAHIILEGILEKDAAFADVPMKVNAGMEVIEKAKTRRMMNEWYKFGRDLTTDPVYSPRVTPLLKYDHRDLPQSALEPQYRYKGGNLYTFLIKVGNGRASYLPAGHANDELMAAGTSFDGGTGDFDRYLAQTLFFLAGYKTEVCAGTACEGLPIVDANDRLTGGTVGIFAKLDPHRMAFASLSDGPYEAVLSDVSGRAVAVKRGTGKSEYAFDEASLKPGIYFMRVKVGKAAPMVRHYVVARGR